jgi:hypothetical protein
MAVHGRKPYFIQCNAETKPNTPLANAISTAGNPNFMTEQERQELRMKPKMVTQRRDRSNDSREDLLAEILNAEVILDGMDAKPGLTLWGRIASIKNNQK